MIQKSGNAEQMARSWERGMSMSFGVASGTDRGVIPEGTPGSKWKGITLEMSLKAVLGEDEEGVEAVCERLYRQWSLLLCDASLISLLLWVGDGSEILDWQGDFDAPMEWGCYIGSANPHKPVPNDPEKKALHSRTYLFRENPPPLTGRSLRNLIGILRECFQRLSGKEVRVGVTFDPGGEFAPSDFKYRRHPEICLGGSAGQGERRFVTCYAKLAADERSYAGFPEGIPQETPFGTFLGRQCRLFLKSMGFDYIWFSNGFGFGMEPWRIRGPLFDGRAFHPERAASVADAIVGFWEAFRAECPDFPVEVRGTNLMVGTDLSTDAVPHQRLLSGDFGFAAPPNSPWAAIDGDFGLELAGYLSRIAELPPDAEGFPFRFYTHDPWWMNSPWLDRYEHWPHDIFLPMSVGRLDESGHCQSAEVLEFLSVDDSLGRMPEEVPTEVIPWIRQCFERRPDRPGPLLWVYPFDEYHTWMFTHPPKPEAVFCGDWFIRSAINRGLPVNSVVSTRIFNLLSREGKPSSIPIDSILLSVVPPAGTPLEESLLRHFHEGGGVFLYGPLQGASQTLLDLLGVQAAAPLSGELEMRMLDATSSGGVCGVTTINHRPELCGGGIEAFWTGASEALPLAIASDGKTERVLACLHRAAGTSSGTIIWVRGSNPFFYSEGQHLPKDDNPEAALDAANLFLHAFAQFGWEIAPTNPASASKSPVVTVSRHDNAFIFSGYTRNTNTELRLRAPFGAPLLHRWETQLRNGASHYRMPRGWQEECRVFIEGQLDGELSCRIEHSGAIGVSHRICVSGLKGATVHFFPPVESGPVTFLVNPVRPYFQGDFREPVRITPSHWLLPDITGSLLISW